MLFEPCKKSIQNNALICDWRPQCFHDNNSLALQRDELAWCLLSGDRQARVR